MKKIVDGNLACSRIAYLFSEVCSIYPITPSSPMASNVDLLTNSDIYNLFHDKPRVVEMESEAGAAGAMHGALLTGSLASTFTASQGLLLMIPNMYKMAGEMLPGVIHVASRSLATHALSIFGDHQDIYATRQTGFCFLASSSVEDAQNLAAVAHLSAIKGSLPFVHFFDGFRTSHELNTIEELNDADLLKLVDYKKIEEFKNRTLNVGHKVQYGMAQNEDIYFQCMEGRNKYYDAMPDIVNDYMQEINKLTKRDYKPFNYYGSSEATNVIIAMGSVCDTIKLVVDKIPKAGLVEVHLYRPFSAKYLISCLPKTVKNIAVIDRTKEAGSIGEPLYLDVLSALKDKDINIVGGRYGLASKNTTPSDIAAVYEMLATNIKNNFTIGINDDVTNLSLPITNFTVDLGLNELKIYGFGSDGMVSASKDLLKIVHQFVDKYVQGYFEYDSKKSGGVTISHLRYGNHKINAPYYVERPEIIVVTKDVYFRLFDIVNTLKEEGILLINTIKTEEELKKLLPAKVKNYIYDHKIKVYYLDAETIASSAGIRGKISKIMEVLILNLLHVANAIDMVKENVRKSFATKGENVINGNLLAIDQAISALKELKITEKEEILIDIKNEDVLDLIKMREGNNIPVSKLMNFANGSFPLATSDLEKRGISNIVPFWHKENCIQCGFCSFVCPHAVIRSITHQDSKKGLPFLGQKDLQYEIVISEADCTGCGLCASICPGKNGVKALEMQEKTTSKVGIHFKSENINPLNKFTVKGSQLQRPLFEFSGACAGCGETPYLKLLTQLFGHKLVIANATGCSSIYGGSVPSSPYLIPWANSLFEDNAEFALGMHMSYQQKRERIAKIMTDSLMSVDENVKNLFQTWLDNRENFAKTMEVKEKLANELIPKELQELQDYIPARSIWAIGGDGWAYDIGYGGLDHVLHSNQNIKVLVLDTEVYSNTGGQASKSTKLGAVAEFANFGKKTCKKDLFKMACAIPNCYVASICLGADFNQAIKAFKEADEHTGPAIIIAYAPCIEHGIKSGMNSMLNEQKLAVSCGYTLLMRYDGEKYYLDSKEPDFNKYEEFLDNEVRFNALKIKDQNLANILLNDQIEYAKKRYAYFQQLSNKD